MGGMENFHMQAFFYMRLPAQTIFLCVSPFSCKHFFLLAYCLFQYLQPLQTIYFKICHLPPPRQKNDGPSLTVTV